MKTLLKILILSNIKTIIKYLTDTKSQELFSNFFKMQENQTNL